MNFFFHTGLGAVYFAVLIAVCGYALLRGKAETKALAAIFLAVFLADRTSLVFSPTVKFALALGAVIDFIALVATLTVRSWRAKFVAAFYAAKIGAYVLFFSDALNWQTMAAWTETFGYLQLLVIGAGTVNDHRGRSARVRASAIPDAGVSGNVAPVASRVPTE